jgi:integrase
LFRSVNRHGQLQDARLSEQTVALVVKRYAEAAGLDPANYAGHSLRAGLRAGLVTTAAIAGVSERAIMKQTGHKSTAMVRRYIRDANLFRENAAARIGL